MGLGGFEVPLSELCEGLAAGDPKSEPGGDSKSVISTK